MYCLGFELGFGCCIAQRIGEFRPEVLGLEEYKHLYIAYGLNWVMAVSAQRIREFRSEV